MSDHMKTIKDTKITEHQSNGARKQEIIFKDGDSKFKISINDETYKGQSFGSLYKWTDNQGWGIITNENPHQLGTISYQTSYSATHFNPLIAGLKKIAKEFV